jgi:simple sugar transport system substrate-binding protein
VNLLKTIGVALVAVVIVAVAAGCEKREEVKGGSSSSGGGDKPLVVGFIYVGTKDDYGYNQSHAEGAAIIKKLAGVKVLEEEKVTETMDVQKSMESMISLDGASLIFPTSFGYYDPHMLLMARKYPNVTFLHCGGRYREGVDPQNCGSYFGYIDEAVYCSGIAAGGTTKSGRLGFVAAKPIPQVLRNINAFLLGARSVNPRATVTVIFTGEWFMPNKEAEAVNNLADQGVDVVTCHVDSPKVVLETAKARKIMSCGYHANGSALDPQGYLTGAEWNWGKIYTNYVETIKAGKKPPHLVRGGLKDGFVKCSPLGPTVPAEIKKKVEAVKSDALAGKLVIFKGPLKDNTGNLVIAAGTETAQTDPVLETMQYLVEGVVGSTR